MRRLNRPPSHPPWPLFRISAPGKQDKCLRSFVGVRIPLGYEQMCDLDLSESMLVVLHWTEEGAMSQLVSTCKSLFVSRSQSRRVGEMPSDLTSSDYTQTTSGVLFPANLHPVSDMQLATQESYAIDICIPWLQVLHPAPTLLAKVIYWTSRQKSYSLCRVLERGCSSATLDASPKELPRPDMDVLLPRHSLLDTFTIGKCLQGPRSDGWSNLTWQHWIG